MDKTATQRNTQYRPPEFWSQLNTYQSWNRPPELILGEILLYQIEIKHFLYMNDYYGYSKRHVFKIDSGKYVLKKRYEIAYLG